MERPNYISPSDTDDEAKAKLGAKFKCSPADMCNTCEFNPRLNKTFFPLQYLDCEEIYRKKYYGPTKIDQMKQNVELNVELLHVLQNRIVTPILTCDVVPSFPKITVKNLMFSSHPI